MRGPRFIQLSDQFVDSLRAFFDSVDVDRTGLVSYENICSHWRRFPPRLVHALPASFPDHLARTVPPSGLVSFERFLAGVRISIAEQRQTAGLKRVQSEGANLNVPPSPVNSNSESINSRPLGDIEGGRRSVGPLRGVIHHPSRKPPAYGASTPSSTATNDSDPVRVQLRSKRHSHSNVRNSVHGNATSNGSMLHFRPISSNSMTSNCSSSMAEIRWRDSRMSAASTPLCDPATTPLANGNARQSLYLPEHTPQVTKHEKLLSEEYEMIRKGLDTCAKLTAWYEQRITSLDKRRDMLNRGMVALDSAVHEQKLNFIRAQVSELNRRMNAFMTASEKGFPNHGVSIRSAVAPAGDSSSSTTTACSTPESMTVWLQTQNSKLAEEVDAKNRLIDELQREKRLYEMQNATRATPTQALFLTSRGAPMAMVRPAMQPPSALRMQHRQSPLKVPDTLL